MAFVDTLIETRNGGVAIDLENALEAVVQGVLKTGKTGKLILELQVLAANKGSEAGPVFLKDTIKTVIPELDKKLTLFFADEKGQLSKRDTRQSDMFEGLREEVNQ